MPLVLAILLASLGLHSQPLPSFDRMQALEAKGETSAGVSLGDLNGDGLLDLILAKGRHWPLHDRVLLNDGKKGYSATNLGKVPDRTYSAALADIDRDGDLDVLVSNDAPDRKLIYKNDGRARFTEAGTFGEANWSTRYIDLADLNGDGFADIIVANRGGDKPVPSFACLNDRQGAFPRCDAVSTGSSTTIVAADLDGDGFVDLFVPHRDGGQSLALWNDGKGRFADSTKVGPANSAARIAVAGDLNADGLVDLVVIDEARRGTFLMLNNGARKFADPVQLPARPGVPYALGLVDLNQDRKLDVVVGFIEAPGVVYFNQANNGIFRPVSWNDAKGTVYAVVFTDVDGDGWKDIVAARSDAPNGIWFARKPAGK